MRGEGASKIEEVAIRPFWGKGILRYLEMTFILNKHYRVFAFTQQKALCTTNFFKKKIILLYYFEKYYFVP